MTPDQRTRVAELMVSGHSARSAAEVLRSEGMALGKTAINDEFRRLRSGAPAPAYTPRAPMPAITAAQPKSAPTSDPLPSIDDCDRDERDPARLAERDWRWYEEEILNVRALARQMFNNLEFKHYNDLLTKAEKLERRAKDLRPPTPPNPDTDPTYRAEARRLENYLDALVTVAEQGQPLPERTLPPTEAIAA